MAEKVGLSNETLDSDTMSQNWCNKSVLWKFKCWHCCIGSVVICAVIIIIIIISSGDSVYCSGETHNNLDQDANIDCSGSQTFNGTFNLDSETTGNNRSLQEKLQQKLVEIYNSSHLRSCLCSSRINTFRNAKVTFELKFQLPQNSSQCQEQNTRNVYSVLYAYIWKQNSSDPLKINLPSLLIF